jgi:hypothetical protein
MSQAPSSKPASPFGLGDLNQIIMHINKDPCCCVPFLGAGVNVGSERYEGLLLGRQLAQEFLKTRNFIYEGPESERENLSKVSLQFEMRTTRNDLIGKLKELIPDDDYEPSPLLVTLAKLPLRLIITTNYDRLMEQALEMANKIEGKHYITIVQPPAGWDVRSKPHLQRQFEEWAAFDGLLLYKIHGSFIGPTSRKKNLAPKGAADSPKCPLIITEEDYIEFMTAMGTRDGERVGIPDCIRDRMQRAMLLFLGYGLEDWDIRSLYKGLIDSLEKDDRRDSFAIQKEPNELWKTFWGDRKVRIKDFDLYQFADELHFEYFGEPLNWCSRASAAKPDTPASNSPGLPEEV